MSIKIPGYEDIGPEDIIASINKLNNYEELEKLGCVKCEILIGQVNRMDNDLRFRERQARERGNHIVKIHKENCDIHAALDRAATKISDLTCRPKDVIINELMKGEIK